VQWSPSREDAPAASRGNYEEPARFEASGAEPVIGTGVERNRRTVRPVGYEGPAAAHLAARNPYAARHLNSRTSPVVGQMHTHYSAGEVVEELPGRPNMPLQNAPIIGDDYPGAMNSSYPANGYVDDGYAGYGNGYQGCGNGCSGQSCCGPGNCEPANCGNACFPCFCLPVPNFCNFEAFAGAQGFTGPANRGGTSSFGFHEGMNWGTPVFCGFAAQAGVNVVHSNFNGSALTASDRRQTFVTLGGYRRVDWGLQGGLVIDYLNDEWDYNVDLTQLRGEVSWIFGCNHEVGFWFSTGTDRDSQTVLTPTSADGEVFIDNRRVTFEATDLYAFFYRRQFCCTGQGRVFGGFTGNSQGIFGGDFRFPINPCLSFQSDFIYLSSSERDDGLDFIDESWNLSFNIVWTPFASRGCKPCGPNYCRPLFDVANNGSFIPGLSQRPQDPIPQ